MRPGILGKDVLSSARLVDTGRNVNETVIVSTVEHVTLLLEFVFV